MKKKEEEKTAHSEMKKIYTNIQPQKHKIHVLSIQK